MGEGARRAGEGDGVVHRGDSSVKRLRQVLAAAAVVGGRERDVRLQATGTPLGLQIA